ncbi:MAG: Asp-tRNA(Asn)/Glu-tRNA(Gln) amidotransferase subunit GatA [Candidatus Dadabacteria bacterium]|nr:MAG: Asp-tRNA(Asn)/Glu-tRNA(Gln) amidotransferase subunit GatA [Candidatus Dadabacteria bacterium]
MELLGMTVRRLRGLLDRGEVTSEEVTRAYLDRIEALNPKLNAYITVTPDLALEMARAADARIRAGEAGPLTGIPVGLKDLLVTQGVRTTCASRILENFVPPYDGTAVARLREAGAVFLGKLNLDEFAMGSSNETSAFGPVRNPWDPERVPGGSSGGSAAAVAAGLAAATLGSDTGGSIRQPAALCGVVGLKPTYGRVSRYGLVAFASSLDQIGPLTWEVADAAWLFQAIAGHDPLDSTSIDRPVPDLAALEPDVKGLRVGVPREYFIEGLDPEVEAAVRRAIGVLEAQGAEVREVSLPHTEYAVATYYLIAPAEASSNLARYDGVKYGLRVPGEDLIDTYRKTRAAGFGAEVKRRIMLGTYALSAGYYDAYYLKAQRVRARIAEDFRRAFAEVDVIACPTTPTPAFRLGEKVDDPLQMYLNDIFTIPANLAGLPGISVPCGVTEAGLPVGFQLLAGAFEEETLLRAAYAYEQAAGLERRPDLSKLG